MYFPAIRALKGREKRGIARTARACVPGVFLGTVLLAFGCAGRYESAGSPVARSLPRAPEFVASSVSGELIRLADAYGEWVALFFFCGCQPCRVTAQQLSDLSDHFRNGNIWGLSELNPADIRSFARETGVKFPLAGDPNASIQQAFAVQRCPTVVLIDPRGSVESRWSSDTGAPTSLTDSTLWRTMEVESGR